MISVWTVKGGLRYGQIAACPWLCADLQILPNPGDGCTIERSNEDIELCIGQRLYELLDLQHTWPWKGSQHQRKIMTLFWLEAAQNEVDRFLESVRLRR